MTVAGRKQINSSDDFDFKDIFRNFLENWKVILACVSLAVCCAVLYLRETRSVYAVDGLVQIEDNQSASDMLLGSLGGIASGLSNLAGLAGKSPADTEIQLLRSRFVLGRVIHNLNLDIGLSSDQDKWYRRLFNPISARVLYSAEGVRYSADATTFEIHKFDVPEVLLDQPLKVTFLSGGRYTLEILNKSKIPGFENQSLIDGVVGQLLTRPISNGELNLLITKNDSVQSSFYLTKKSLLNSVKEINDNLSITEQGKQTGILALVYQGVDQDRIAQTLNNIMQVYLQQNIESRTAETKNTLDFLERQLPKSKTELEAAEDRYNAFREKNNTIDPSQEAQLLLQQAVDLKTKKIELEQQRVLLGQKYTSNFPLVTQAKAQEDAIDGNLQDLETRIKAMPDLQRQYLQVYRDVQVDTALYTSLLNSSQQLKVVSAGKVASVRVLDEAVEANVPVKPKKPLVLMLSVVLGIAISTILIVFKNIVLSGVKDSSLIEAQTGVPVIATVPRSESRGQSYGRNAKRRELLATVDPEDLAIESLRSLRTQIHFASSKMKNNIILITGPSPDIGKSFVSANFAAVLAQMGKTVVLVDADMRRGTLRSYFGLDIGSGLSDYLQNTQIEIEDVCKDTAVDGLAFIEKGTASLSPAELLVTERFKLLVKTLSEKYDYVLLDSPPVLAATDATILTEMAGMTLIIARFARTHMRELELSLARLSQVGGSVSGIVLNGVQKGDGYGYGYRYAYQYRSDK